MLHAPSSRRECENHSDCVGGEGAAVCASETTDTSDGAFATHELGEVISSPMSILEFETTLTGVSTSLDWRGVSSVDIALKEPSLRARQT